MTKPKLPPRYWPSKSRPSYSPPLPAISGKRLKPPLHQPREKPPRDDFNPPLPRTQS